MIEFVSFLPVSGLAQIFFILRPNRGQKNDCYLKLSRCEVWMMIQHYLQQMEHHEIASFTNYISIVQFYHCFSLFIITIWKCSYSPLLLCVWIANLNYSKLWISFELSKHLFTQFDSQEPHSTESLKKVELIIMIETFNEFMPTLFLCVSKWLEHQWLEGNDELAVHFGRLRISRNSTWWNSLTSRSF